MNEDSIKSPYMGFVVGTTDLSITGSTWDGREIPVFVEGNFAF